MRRIFRFSCFLLAVILCITVFSSFAFADVFSSQAAKTRFGAWILSALTALNITVDTVAAPIIDSLDFFSDPFQIVDQVVEPVRFTEQWADDFFDRSVISIDGDTVTIDGKEYYDIWLSHDAANKFRVNAFDIEDAWDIASESEGTFVSGSGYLDGVPIFDTNNGLISQKYVFSDDGGKIGDYTCQILSDPSKSGKAWRIYNSDGSFNTSSFTYYSPFLSQLRILSNGSKRIDIGSSRSGGFPDGTLVVSGDYFAQPFDFDWVAGTIPAEPLDQEDGLHWYVPADPDQWQDYPDVQDIIDEVVQYLNDNPDIGPGQTSPMIDPDLKTKIDDLIDLIIPIIPFIDMQFGPEGQQPGPSPVDPVQPDPQPEPFPDPVPVPYPDPDPEPGTTISDTDWKSLFDVLKNIFNRLASIDLSSQTISNVVTEMRNKFEYWFDDLRNNIQTGVQDIISSISSLGDTILQDIETGPIIRIQRGLDKIKQIFLPVLIPLKNALGIWHYVVEWLQAISLPFQWILSIGSQGYSMIMIPIYACVAGTLCIVVYRKFGR